MLTKTLLTVIIFKLITANVTKKDEKISQLENEKNELFKQIHKAIDDSIQSLQKSNNTDAVLGIRYMYELQQHLMKENEDTTDDNQVAKNVSDLANRRTFKIDKKKKSKHDAFDFESILRPKKMTEIKWREMMSNRDKMQKQLNEWITKREKEKERLKQYHLYKKGLVSSGKYEKCPRFGYKSKKNKKSIFKDKKYCKDKKVGRNSDEGYKECADATKHKNKSKDTLGKDMKDANLKVSKKTNYPCCRKCCKKSYMGCL